MRHAVVTLQYAAGLSQVAQLRQSILYGPELSRYIQQGISKRYGKAAGRSHKMAMNIKYWADNSGKFTEQQLEYELTMAREIQQGFLPQEYTHIPGLEFSHLYIPIFEVGGDFFDINELSPGVVEVFISDVMGHGPQAARITGIIRVSPLPNE